MITPYLEELIHMGKAQNITFNGMGGVSIYRIPKGKHAVLHNLIVHPFTDLDATEDYDTIVDMMKKVLQQFTITSKTSANHFMFRFGLQTIDTGAGIVYQPTYGGGSIDTYLTHSMDVVFEWLHAPDPSVWTLSEAPLPAESNNPSRTNIGYGTVASGGLASMDDLRYNDVSSSRYKPFGSFTPSNGINAFNEFQFPANADTRMNVIIPGSKTLYPYNFPMFTAQMVLIDGNPNSKFKPSN
jgi:hypothetical protein